MSSLLKNLLIKPSTECLIYDKPSIIDDTDNCIEKKKSNQLFKSQPDLCEEDQFRACFIDCSCDCSVRKVLLIIEKTKFFFFCLRQKKLHKIE